MQMYNGYILYGFGDKKMATPMIDLGIKKKFSRLVRAEGGTQGRR